MTAMREPIAIGQCVLLVSGDSMKLKKMTFLKFHCIRVVFFMVDNLLLFFAFVLLQEWSGGLSNGVMCLFPVLAFSADIVVTRCFRGDLFSEKYKNSMTQLVFKGMYVLDYVIVAAFSVTAIVQFIRG